MKLPQRVNAALAAALLLDTCLAATSGKLSILSMNVAGLPPIFNGNDVPGDKATNAASIGTKFAEYGHDVIHVQEVSHPSIPVRVRVPLELRNNGHSFVFQRLGWDRIRSDLARDRGGSPGLTPHEQDFNYHAHIYRTDTHPFRTATSGGVPFGSGLNTLSNFDWVDFRRVKWDTCSNASGADCLTPKGFTFMRAAVSRPADNSTAVYVDFYNLHTDAGGEDEDLAARQHNVNQVSAYISQWSKGNAVVVHGDTNSRYSRVADTAIRSLLASENAGGPGMADPWIELQRGGIVPTEEVLCSNPSSDNVCEVVDKVFYRSSPLVTLQAETFRYDSGRFLQADGNVLSDHNPVFVDFAWSSGSSLRQSDFFGGAFGTWFSDVPALASIAKPKPVTLAFRGGSRLDGVGLTLGDGTIFRHGGTSGTEVSLELGPSEYWVEAELCRGEKSGKTRNFYIQAATSLGRTLKAGTMTADCATYSAPDGWQIVGFVGQDGDEIDQLAFVYAPQ